MVTINIKSNIEQEIDKNIERLENSPLLKDSNIEALKILCVDETINAYLKNLINLFKKELKSIQNIVDSKKYPMLGSPTFIHLKVLTYINFLEGIDNFPNTIFFNTLLQAMQKLTQAQKRVFYYAYIEQLNVKGIESITRTKNTTIKSHLKDINACFGYENDSSIKTLENLFKDRPEGVSNDLVHFILNLPRVKDEFKK